jgi:signal peptidase I
MSVPPFALPPADYPEADHGRPSPAPPAPRSLADRARCLASLAALGAAALAATLAVSAAIAVFEHDVIGVIARPGVVASEAAVQELRQLATLPGASMLALAALVPAACLLVAAVVLRWAGAEASRVPAVSAEALAAAELTMAWSVRAILVVALLLVLVPAALEVAGIRAISLTSGSMAPAHLPGSLLLVVEPADRGSLAVGTVIVARRADGSRVTHRIVAVEAGADGRAIAYWTRGDAVGVVDPEPVAPDAVEGSVAGSLPILGALRAWLTSPLGIAIGLVLLASFALLRTLLGDERRRVERAYPVARSTSRPTS